MQENWSEIYWRTKAALRMLIVNSQEVQRSDWGKEQREIAGLHTGFVDSICTVRLTGPRRSGHTTAMIEVGKELFNKPLFLFHNHARMQQIKNEFNLQQNQYDNIQSSIESMRGKTHDGVMIDCSFFTSESLQNEIRNASIHWAEPFETFCLVYIQ